MKYRISVTVPDGLAQDPGYTVDVETPKELDDIGYELCNDYGVALPVGTRLTVERLS